MPEREIHFFDVDHTITRRSSGRHFVTTGVQVGLFPFGSLLSIPFYYMQYRMGGMGDATFNRELPGLKGSSREILEEISLKSFKEKLIKDIYSDAVDCIQSVRASEKRVVLATSSVDIIVRPLAEYLGIKDIIASSLEFVDGICTGRFLDSPTFKGEKRRRVIDFAQGFGISPGQCSFYSDSINDLPLLEVIGNPIAVNPDIRLRRIAVKRGWTILKFNR